MNTLSVCLIAKNEESVIRRVLECASTFADEIIVVDTGSTDNTKNIALEFTKNVYDYEWNDDFSAARNYSFSKATMDYIMWLDCDDIINPANQEKIKELKLNGFTANTITANYRRSPTTVLNVIRIVKRDTAKWYGFIHEYLDTHGQRCNSDIEIVHAKPDKYLLRDTGRNLRIFEKKKSEHVPFTVRDILYYAKELYWNNRYGEAIVEIDNYFACQSRWVEDDIQISIIKASCFEALHRNDDALSTLASAIVSYGMNPRLVYNAAMLCYNMKKYNQAIMYYQAIISNICKPSVYFADSYDFMFHSLIWLSCAYWNLGRKEIGKQFHEKAKELQPNNEIVLNNNKFFD